MPQKIYFECKLQWATPRIIELTLPSTGPATVQVILPQNIYKPNFSTQCCSIFWLMSSEYAWVAFLFIYPLYISTELNRK